MADLIRGTLFVLFDVVKMKRPPRREQETMIFVRRDEYRFLLSINYSVSIRGGKHCEPYGPYRSMQFSFSSTKA